MQKPNSFLPKIQHRSNATYSPLSRMSCSCLLQLFRVSELLWQPVGRQPPTALPCSIRRGGLGLAGSRARRTTRHPQAKLDLELSRLWAWMTISSLVLLVCVSSVCFSALLTISAGPSPSQSSIDVSATASSTKLGSNSSSVGFERLQLLLSLDVSLEIIHAARESLKRAETFQGYPGRYGHRVRETIEELFILMLQTLSERHILSGFSL